VSVKDLVKHSPRRRSFLKDLAAGTAAAVAVGNLRAAGQETPAPAPVRPSGKVTRDGMVYRRLGCTNLYISEISLGGSPLPDERLLFRLIERGINYLDVSESYENGNVERLAGRALKAFGRDRIIIATRFNIKDGSTEASIIASAEASLRRLETDHVEVLGIHGAQDPKILTDERVLGAFDKLKAQGKFLFRGVTCHVNQHTVIPEAVACGLYDMVQMGYNVFDIQETEKDVKTYGDYLGESGVRGLLDLAAAKDVGVTAMKVLKVGGRRQDLAGRATGGTTLFQAMLKWALSEDRIAAVVTEILNESQMEEDLAVVGQPLTVADRRVLHDHVAANARGYCHFCGLCQAACPAGVRTADISRCLAYVENYGKTERGRSEFRRILEERGPLTCRDCGVCERACPYGVSVRDRTRRASGLFA
jgi:uncharacterized protein